MTGPTNMGMTLQGNFPIIRSILRRAQEIFLGIRAQGLPRYDYTPVVSQIKLFVLTVNEKDGTE